MAFKDKSYLNKPAKGVVTYNKDIVLSVINLAAKEIACCDRFTTYFCACNIAIKI